MIRNGTFSGYGPICNISSYEDTHGDLVKITKVVTIMNGSFFSAWLRSAVKGYVSKDATSVTFRPRNITPSCLQRTQVVSFVQTSCPTGLSIRLIPQFPCILNFTTFNIEQKYMKNSNGTDKIGFVEPGVPAECPYYGDVYQPKLGLYYFYTLIENVTADFYMFDTNGRQDFSYNMTEIDAGCLRQAQTYSLWNISNNLPQDPNLIWGPRTYRHCFDAENGSIPSSKQRYEIFNGTNGNAVTFESDHEAVFVMVAHILANNYSFCDLQVGMVLPQEGLR